MTDSPRYLRRYWTLLTIAAILYGVTAGITLMRARTGANTEIFPIFSWDLFSVVPNETSDYGLRIVSIDGRPLDPPQFLERLSAFDAKFSVSAHMAIQELGAAKAHGDVDRVRALHRLLYQNYLGGDARRARYELVRRRYDVLERWRSGRFRELTRIDLSGVVP